MKAQKRKTFNTKVLSPEKCYSSILRVAIGSTSISDREELLGYVRRHDYAALLKWSERPSPQLYGSANSYFGEVQIAALIKKYPFTPQEVPGLNPEETALTKFFQSEEACKETNLRISNQRTSWDPAAEFKQLARDYISRTIGFAPDMERVYSLCDVTGGASMGINGDKTNVARKICASRWTVTPGALQYAIPALWHNSQIRDCILPGAMKCYDPLDFVSRIRERCTFVDHNNISFVPKTAKTHRSIAVEPFLNGFIQKGTDEYLRACLLRRGIDLSDQSRNQALALEGSLGGTNPYVTIDLAAASDSLSIEVVRDLVPPEWFEYLSDIRAPYFMLPGQKLKVSSDCEVGVKHEYAKFCSMGNGFCFPLQTLIFASVCHAAMHQCGYDDDFSVYGDDIIIRQGAALLAVEMLQELGFRTNVDKTFITGPFRESCGADWYEGQDVRPVHLKERLADVRELFSFHNSCERSPWVSDFFTEVRPVVRSFGGGKFLRPGKEPGDTCYSVPLDIAMSSPFTRWDIENSQWSWKEVKSRPIRDVFRLSEIEYANILMLACLRGSKSHEPFCLRRVTTPTVVRVSRPFRDGYPHGPSVALTKLPKGRIIHKAAKERLLNGYPV